MLLNEETRTPLPLERSGPSHGGQPQAAPTPRESQRRFSSDDEGPPAPVETLPFGQIPPDPTLSASDEEESVEWSGPRLGLVRRGRGGGHTVRKRTRTRRRVVNPFIEMEAEEGDGEESGSESESSPRGAFASANTQTLTPSHYSDEDSSDSSDLDEDSSDYYELDNSFLVADDYFE